MKSWAKRIVECLGDPRIERLGMLGILMLSLVVRVVFAMFLPDQSGALPDSSAYRAAASQLVSAHLISSDFIMPGYPSLIALAGPGIGQIAVDIALSVVSVWCVMRIVREISGDALSATIAGLMWAVYPFSLFYAAVGLTETMFVTLLLLGFLAFYQKAYLLGSAAMVLSILTRPSVEVLTPLLILVFVLIVHRAGYRRALRCLAVFTAVYIAMMSPWWWHNAVKYGQFVRLNLASGYVLYAGNNPMNKSGGGIVSIDYDPTKFRAISDPVARDRAFRSAAIDYIAANPAQTASLMWLKLKRLWRPWPYATEYVQPVLVVISVATIVPLVLLAAAGIIRAIISSRWRPLAPILMFIGFTSAVQMVTIASIRYRFPMEPFLVILAAPVLAHVIRRFSMVRESKSSEVIAA